MQQRTRSRRSFLKAAGVGTIASLAGCTAGQDESDGEDEATTTEADAETTTAEPTEDEAAESDGPALADQLDRVRSATEGYADPEAALEDGFQLSGPYVPGMGWHFVHPERNREYAESDIDIERPNMLTYLETDDGLELAAVEYGVPTDADVPDLFDDEDAEAEEEWHTHEAATHVFAVPDGEATDMNEVSFEDLTTNDHWAEFHPPDGELARGDEVALNWGTPHGKEGDRTERVADLVTNHPGMHTLHAWVHVDNPEGVFAPVHPEYTDDGHHHD